MEFKTVVTKPDEANQLLFIGAQVTATTASM